MYDTVYPDNVGSGTVVITVQRNPSAPAFQGDNYQRTIDERIELGTSVLQLAARDADGVSSIFPALVACYQSCIVSCFTPTFCFGFIFLSQMH